MPVEDHPVHARTSFKEVPLSTCHSSLPDLTRKSYYVMNLIHPQDGPPHYDTVLIDSFSDNKCKQPIGTLLPECRGCTTPGDLHAALHDS
jgi:hypothetical protein